MRNSDTHFHSVGCTLRSIVNFYTCFYYLSTSQGVFTHLWEPHYINMTKSAALICEKLVSSKSPPLTKRRTLQKWMPPTCLNKKVRNSRKIPFMVQNTIFVVMHTVAQFECVRFLHFVCIMWEEMNLNGCSRGTIVTAIFLSLQLGCVEFNISVLMHPAGLPMEKNLSSVRIICPTHD